MASTKGNCKVLVQRQRDGTYNIGVAIKNVPLRKTADGRKYVLVDFVGQVPVMIDCDGIKLKPVIVLKIHRQLSREQRIRLDEMRGLEYIRKSHGLI